MSGPTYGRVLWDNLLTTGTPTYSGTEVSGFEKENAVDTLDFSMFRVTKAGAGTQTLDYVWGSAVVIDHAAWFLKVPDSSPSSYTITLSLETANGSAVFNVFMSMTFTTGVATEVLRARSWGPHTLAAGARARWTVTVPAGGILDIRELYLGRALVFPIGQHVSAVPFGFTGGGVSGTVVSTGGCVLARTLTRVTKSATIKLEYLTNEWVTAFWEPFAVHARKRGFFYLWDMEDHPSHCAYAIASSVPFPQNTMPVPTMSVSMELTINTGEVL